MKSLKSVSLCEIKEVWESFSGWYWFVTEYHEGTLAFGLVRGWEVEWGYFDLTELRELERTSKVWRVPKTNWAFCPCVETTQFHAQGRREPWRPDGRLGEQHLKGGDLNMEQNQELKVEAEDKDVFKNDVAQRDSIMLRVTKAGNGLKVVHNGIWYYASRVKVLDVVNGRTDRCLFVTM